MKRSSWLKLTALIIGLACIVLAFRVDSPDEGLFVYCGAGIRPAMKSLCEDFTKQTGVRVQTAYAGSGCLLSMLAFAKTGDLYMPGEQEYVDQGKRKGYITDDATVGYFVAVVIVQKGNPKGIRTLADLARSDIKVGIGNPDSVACGLVAKKILQKAGVWEKVYENIEARGTCTATAMELSNAVVLNALDAVINWDAMAYPVRDKVDILTIPREQNVDVAIPLATLSWSKRQAEAARFTEFALSAAGRKHFAAHGYHTTLTPYALPYYGENTLD